MRDKIHRFTEAYRNRLIGISVDSLPLTWQREQFERFAAENAPDLRKHFPDTLWGPAA